MPEVWRCVTPSSSHRVRAGPSMLDVMVRAIRRGESALASELRTLPDGTQWLQLSAGGWSLLKLPQGIPFFEPESQAARKVAADAAATRPAAAPLPHTPPAGKPGAVAEQAAGHRSATEARRKQTKAPRVGRSSVGSQREGRSSVGGQGGQSQSQSQSQVSQDLLGGARLSQGQPTQAVASPAPQPGHTRRRAPAACGTPPPATPTPTHKGSASALLQRGAAVSAGRLSSGPLPHSIDFDAEALQQQPQQQHLLLQGGETQGGGAASREPAAPSPSAAAAAATPATPVRTPQRGRSAAEQAAFSPNEFDDEISKLKSQLRTPLKAPHPAGRGSGGSSAARAPPPPRPFTLCDYGASEKHDSRTDVLADLLDDFAAEHLSVSCEGGTPTSSRGRNSAPALGGSVLTEADLRAALRALTKAAGSCHVDGSGFSRPSVAVYRTATLLAQRRFLLSAGHEQDASLLLQSLLRAVRRGSATALFYMPRIAAPFLMPNTPSPAEESPFGGQDTQNTSQAESDDGSHGEMDISIESLDLLLEAVRTVFFSGQSDDGPGSEKQKPPPKKPRGKRGGAGGAGGDGAKKGGVPKGGAMAPPASGLAHLLCGFAYASVAVLSKQTVETERAEEPHLAYDPVFYPETIMQKTLELCTYLTNALLLPNTIGKLGAKGKGKAGGTSPGGPDRPAQLLKEVVVELISRLGGEDACAANTWLLSVVSVLINTVVKPVLQGDVTPHDSSSSASTAGMHLAGLSAPERGTALTVAIDIIAKVSHHARLLSTVHRDGTPESGAAHPGHHTTSLRSWCETPTPPDYLSSPDTLAALLEGLGGTDTFEEYTLSDLKYKVLPALGVYPQAEQAAEAWEIARGAPRGKAGAAKGRKRKADEAEEFLKGLEGGGAEEEVAPGKGVEVAEAVAMQQEADGAVVDEERLAEMKAGYIRMVEQRAEAVRVAGEAGGVDLSEEKASGTTLGSRTKQELVRLATSLNMKSFKSLAKDALANRIFSHLKSQQGAASPNTASSTPSAPTATLRMSQLYGGIDAAAAHMLDEMRAPDSQLFTAVAWAAHFSDTSQEVLRKAFSSLLQPSAGGDGAAPGVEGAGASPPLPARLAQEECYVPAKHAYLQHAVGGFAREVGMADIPPETLRRLRPAAAGGAGRNAQPDALRDACAVFLFASGSVPTGVASSPANSHPEEEGSTPHRFTGLAVPPGVAKTRITYAERKRRVGAVGSYTIIVRHLVLLFGSQRPMVNSAVRKKAAQEIQQLLDVDISLLQDVWAVLRQVFLSGPGGSFSPPSPLHESYYDMLSLVAKRVHSYDAYKALSSSQASLPEGGVDTILERVLHICLHTIALGTEAAGFGGMEAAGPAGDSVALPAGVSGKVKSLIIFLTTANAASDAAAEAAEAVAAVGNPPEGLGLDGGVAGLHSTFGMGGGGFLEDCLPAIQLPATAGRQAGTSKRQVLAFVVRILKGRIKLLAHGALHGLSHPHSYDPGMLQRCFDQGLFKRRGVGKGGPDRATSDLLELVKLCLDIPEPQPQGGVGAPAAAGEGCTGVGLFVYFLKQSMAVGAAHSTLQESRYESNLEYDITSREEARLLSSLAPFMFLLHAQDTQSTAVLHHLAALSAAFLGELRCRRDRAPGTPQSLPTLSDLCDTQLLEATQDSAALAMMSTPLLLFGLRAAVGVLCGTAMQEVLAAATSKKKKAPAKQSKPKAKAKPKTNAKRKRDAEAEENGEEDDDDECGAGEGAACDDDAALEGVFQARPEAQVVRGALSAEALAPLVEAVVSLPKKKAVAEEDLLAYIHGSHILLKLIPFQFEAVFEARSDIAVAYQTLLLQYARQQLSRVLTVAADALAMVSTLQEHFTPDGTMAYVTAAPTALGLPGLDRDCYIAEPSAVAGMQACLRVFRAIRDVFIPDLRCAVGQGDHLKQFCHFAGQLQRGLFVVSLFVPRYDWRRKSLVKFFMEALPGDLQPDILFGDRGVLHNVFRVLKDTAEVTSVLPKTATPQQAKAVSDMKNRVLAMLMKVVTGLCGKSAAYFPASEKLISGCLGFNRIEALMARGAPTGDSRSTPAQQHPGDGQAVLNSELRAAALLVVFEFLTEEERRILEGQRRGGGAQAQQGAAGSPASRKGGGSGASSSRVLLATPDKTGGGRRITDRDDDMDSGMGTSLMHKYLNVVHVSLFSRLPKLRAVALRLLKLCYDQSLSVPHMSLDYVIAANDVAVNVQHGMAFNTDCHARLSQQASAATGGATRGRHGSDSKPPASASATADHHVDPSVVPAYLLWLFAGKGKTAKEMSLLIASKLLSGLQKKYICAYHTLGVEEAGRIRGVSAGQATGRFEGQLGTELHLASLHPGGGLQAAGQIVRALSQQESLRASTAELRRFYSLLHAVDNTPPGAPGALPPSMPGQLALHFPRYAIEVLSCYIPKKDTALAQLHETINQGLLLELESVQTQVAHLIGRDDLCGDGDDGDDKEGTRPAKKRRKTKKQLEKDSADVDRRIEAMDLASKMDIVVRGCSMVGLYELSLWYKHTRGEEAPAGSLGGSGEGTCALAVPIANLRYRQLLAALDPSPFYEPEERGGGIACIGRAHLEALHTRLASLSVNEKFLSLGKKVRAASPKKKSQAQPAKRGRKPVRREPSDDGEDSSDSEASSSSESSEEDTPPPKAKRGRRS